MPVYEYQCSDGHIFSERQGINDEPLKTCKYAGCRRKVKKLISQTSFVLKGDGWAKDGYKGEKK
jgi:putative FmdB family regulatory protein